MDRREFVTNSALGLTIASFPYRNLLAGNVQPLIFKHGMYQLTDDDRGNLIMVAGSPLIGKTSYAYCMVSNLMRKGKVGTIVSLASAKGRTIGQLRSAYLRHLPTCYPTNRQSVKGHRPEGSPCWTDIVMDQNVVDQPKLSFDEIRWECKKAALLGKLDHLVIDYLQLMKGISIEVTSKLKQLALDFNIPVIAIAPTTRASQIYFHGDKVVARVDTVAQPFDTVIKIGNELEPCVEVVKGYAVGNLKPEFRWWLPGVFPRKAAEHALPSHT